MQSTQLYQHLYYRRFLNSGTPINYTVNTLKLNGVIPQIDAVGIANSEDPDQNAPIWSSLIWVCTVCPNLTVEKFKIIIVLVQYMYL